MSRTSGNCGPAGFSHGKLGDKLQIFCRACHRTALQGYPFTGCREGQAELRRFVMREGVRLVAKREAEGRGIE